VLEVGGSYEEMGRQQADLLGDDLRRVYAVQRQEHERAVARGGFGDRVLDAVGIPLWSGIGGHFEDSHFHEELAGMAAGLGVAPRDLLRALLALGGGSTVFAATRSATADGQALIGRNVDWDDALGARRPVVVRLRPTNGDLEHLFVGWPLWDSRPSVSTRRLRALVHLFRTRSAGGDVAPRGVHRRVAPARERRRRNPIFSARANAASRPSW
jgi:hypothetical protein